MSHWYFRLFFQPCFLVRLFQFLLQPLAGFPSASRPVQFAPTWWDPSHCFGKRRKKKIHSCPKGFTSYCAISNTVKAIGIGGSASLFVTVKMSSFLADSQEAEARNLVALTRSKGLCLLLFPTTHVHPTGPLHSLRTLCALRHGMFHIGKDRVDLDSFAAFLTQPDTVEFAHDGITIDSRAPFTRESWLFTHQITSYGAWTFLPLALRLTMHSARFELTLALRQEVPKPSCFQVTPDLFHWQGHLLDGVRVTLSFGIGCLELASDTFVYVRFPYPEPGSAPQLEVKGWTLTPDCGSYFFSRASHSLGHLHPSRPGVVDPSDYARPASLLKWPATSPATRSRYAHLPHHQTPDAPPKLLPAASIPYYHMGMDQLCQPAVLHDKDLVPSLWLAAFAALIGISLTNEHNALLQHPLIPPQFPSRVIALISPGCPPWLLPFSSPRPSRSFRPTRSTACFLSLSPASVQLGLSRSFRPTQSLAASVLVFTSLFSASPPLPRLSRSFRPTRSLATSSLFLASALPLFMLHLSLNPVGHSGPLGSWQPLFLFSHSPCLLCHHFPTSSPPLGPSGSFRPTRSLATSSLFLASAFLPLSPKPEPSRSFRPTRFLATSHLLSSSTFPGLLVITATTQSVIPAHSVTGFTSEHCAGQRYGNAALVTCRCDKFGLLGTGNIACLFLPSRLWALCSPL